MDATSYESGSRTGAPRRRKRSPSDWRREARRLAERIEAASGERRRAREVGREHGAHDAHMIDVELLGDDAGQAPRYAPTKRPDPYLTSHGGLFERKRAVRER